MMFRFVQNREKLLLTSANLPTRGSSPDRGTAVRRADAASAKSVEAVFQSRASAALRASTDFLVCIAGLEGTTKTAVCPRHSLFRHGSRPVVERNCEATGIKRLSVLPHKRNGPHDERRVEEPSDALSVVIHERIETYLAPRLPVERGNIIQRQVRSLWGFGCGLDRESALPFRRHSKVWPCRLALIRATSPDENLTSAASLHSLWSRKYRTLDGGHGQNGRRPSD